MTKQPHPITPPPKLVQQWCHEDGDEPKTSTRWFYSVCAKAARWGADQELEACCEWLFMNGYDNSHVTSARLRAARRLKPPSLKEQALAVIENSSFCDHLSPQDAATIRRALEALD